MTGKSLVAGIVDAKGGLRMVVTDGDLNCHIGPGERVFILPEQVQEPIPFDQIPDLALKVEQYVLQQLAGDGPSSTNH